MGRLRTKDEWLPERVYKGRSAFEYRRKGGGCIRLAPLTASQKDVIKAHQAILRAVSRGDKSIIFAKRKKESNRRKALNDRGKSGDELAALRLRKSILRVFMAARSRALRSGKVYSLSTDDVAVIIHRAKGRCELTGIEFAPGNGDTFFAPFSPSLDRIDSSRGYMVTNVRLVCTAVNVALNQWGEEIFSQIAEKYVTKKAKGSLLYSELYSDGGEK